MKLLSNQLHLLSELTLLDLRFVSCLFALKFDIIDQTQCVFVTDSVLIRCSCSSGNALGIEGAKSLAGSGIMASSTLTALNLG